MTPEERYADAQAAKLAMDRFVGPALTIIEQEYAERMLQVAGMTLTRDETEWSLLKLATAIKVVRAVRGQIEVIAEGGKVAEQQIDRAKQIENIRPDKRRILGL